MITVGEAYLCSGLNDDISNLRRKRIYYILVKECQSTLIMHIFAIPKVHVCFAIQHSSGLSIHVL